MVRAALLMQRRGRIPRQTKGLSKKLQYLGALGGGAVGGVDGWSNASLGAWAAGGGPWSTKPQEELGVRPAEWRLARRR